MSCKVPVATTQLCHCRKETATDNTYLNECACVPIKLELWTLKFELCIIFTCHKILSFFLFSPQLLKNVKSRLTLQPVEKQVGGWILACGPSWFRIFFCPSLFKGFRNNLQMFGRISSLCLAGCHTYCKP